MLAAIRRWRALGAGWLFVSASLLSPVPASAQAAECVARARYTGAEVVARGLLLRFEGETTYRLYRQGSSDVGGGRLFWMVLDFPGAVRGAEARVFRAVEGPVLRVRSSLYRKDGECGVRISVEFGRYVPVQLERRPEGYLLVTEPPVTAPRAGAGVGPETRASGGVQVSGFFSSSRFAGSTDRSGSAGLGFFQEIRNTGWVRGFLTRFFPARDGGDTFGALGLFGLPLGEKRADLIGGDIALPYAAPGQDAVDFPGQLLFRGGATVLRKAAGFRVFGFYGRSATPDAARLAGTPILAPEISKDRVAGLFGYAPAGGLTVGGGWVRSLPRQAEERDNFFESLSYAFTESVNLGAVVEESRSPKWGWQTTISPRLRQPRFFLSGYYRHASDEFLPALGSNFFAGLRRSFQLAGGAQVTRFLSASAAAGQTRSFNLIDPENVGTTTEFENAAVNFQPLPGWTAGLFFNSTASRTDKGAVNPADSRTDAFGATLGASVVSWGATAAVSREQTYDRAAPSFDFRSNRGQLRLFGPLPGELKATAQASYADSRRAGGASAGQNYSYSIGLERRLGRSTTAGIEAGEDVRPAGVATFGSRTTRVAAHWNTAVQSGLQIGGSLAYEDLRTQGGPSTKGYFVSLFASKSFSWGGRRGPFADAGLRSFNLQETAPDAQMLGAIVLRAFLDRNGNGRVDSGEEPLEGMEFQVDGVTYRTDRKGIARVLAPAGTHEVRFSVGKLAMRMNPSFPATREAEIHERETILLDSPFFAGGRVEGRVVFSGALPPGSSPPVGGLRTRLVRDSAVLREAYTDDEGEFFYGNLPPGRYELEIAEEMPEGITVEGNRRVTIEVSSETPARPVFTLRRKTARERFGEPRV